MLQIPIKFVFIERDYLQRHYTNRVSNKSEAETLLNPLNSEYPSHLGVFKRTDSFDWILWFEIIDAFEMTESSSIGNYMQIYYSHKSSTWSSICEQTIELIEQSDSIQSVLFEFLKKFFSALIWNLLIDWQNFLPIFINYFWFLFSNHKDGEILKLIKAEFCSLPKENTIYSIPL